MQLSRLIITRDKTHVQGEILVDDKPQVTGRKAAVWKHVLFNQSYNQDVQAGTGGVWWSQIVMNNSTVHVTGFLLAGSGEKKRKYSIVHYNIYRGRHGRNGCRIL